MPTLNHVARLSDTVQGPQVYKNTLIYQAGHSKGLEITSRTEDKSRTSLWIRLILYETPAEAPQTRY